MDSPPQRAQGVKVEEFQRKHRIGLLTLVFTDIVGSTQLKQQYGDARAVALIQQHHQLVRDTLARFGPAEEVETAGDSFLLMFAKPSDAVRFALALHARLRAFAGQTGTPVQDRIGIHVGEVFIQEQAHSSKLFGIQVDTCARLTSLGHGNQILMTRFAFDNARQVLKGQRLEGLGELAWISHGFYSLQGVADPLEVCEVAEQGPRPLEPPADSDKARRIIAPEPVPRKRSWLVSPWLLGSLLVLLATALVLRDRALNWIGGVIRPQTRLVVLPFHNDTPGSTNEAFCDGLAEALSAELGTLEKFEPSLRIVPTSYVLAEKVTTPDEAHRLLGATRVLFGRVKRDESHVQVELDLFDPKALKRTFQAAVAQPASNLADLQNVVVREVVQMLRLEPSAKAHKRLAAGQTRTATAYEAYVEGLGKLARYDQEDNLDAAIVLLNRALAQDADYALAHAALGESYWRKYEMTKDATRIAEARTQCAQALRLDPELTAAHVTVGMIDNGTGNYEQAVTELQKALKSDPPNFKALRELGRAYEKRGQLAEAEATFLKAITHRPEDWTTHKELGGFYWRKGDYPQAARSFQEVVRLIPDSYLAHRNLGGLYALMGRTEEATAELNKSLTLRETPEAYSNLGTIAFLKGDYSQAAGLYERAIALGNPSRVLYGNLADARRYAPGMANQAKEAYRHAIQLTEKNLQVNPNDGEERASLALYCALAEEPERASTEIKRALEAAPANVNVMAIAAQTYDALGDRQSALRWLRTALEQGYSRTTVEHDPAFATLRQDPTFRASKFGTNTTTQPQNQKGIQ